MGDLEKFNNYKKQVDDADPSNVEKSDLILASEHAFFLYDNQNIIKETFISEINKKVSLIGSLWYFVKTGCNGRMSLVNSRNKLNFKIKKSQNLAKFSFGISPVVVSKKINFKNRQINNILIVSIDKKARAGQKRKMTEILDTLLIKALQSYDRYTILNPLDIDIRSNYMTEKINNYKGYMYEVCIRNLLFSAGIKSDTQNIFLICHNLNSAKKALINGKLYSLLGIVNLSEINNWSEVQGKSIYVSVKFDDIAHIESATHFAFKFETSFPTEILEFKVELLDDKAKQIEFKDGENKVPAIDLQIDILK